MRKHDAITSGAWRRTPGSWTASSEISWTSTGSLEASSRFEGTPRSSAHLVARVVEDLDVSAHRISILGDSPIVDLDGPKVERIVENLLANAAKFTSPSSTIELRLEAVPNGVLITVDDNGPGVPDDMKSHIFEPFRQATTLPMPPEPGSACPW